MIDSTGLSAELHELVKYNLEIQHQPWYWDQTCTVPVCCMDVKHDVLWRSIPVCPPWRVSSVWHAGPSEDPSTTIHPTCSLTNAEVSHTSICQSLSYVITCASLAMSSTTLTVHSQEQFRSHRLTGNGQKDPIIGYLVTCNWGGLEAIEYWPLSCNITHSTCILNFFLRKFIKDHSHKWLKLTLSHKDFIWFILF